MSTEPSSAFVTGAGSGLGHDLALGLANRGYRVFGTAVAYDEVRDMSAESGGAVNLTVTDIRDQRAVRALAGDVADATKGRLDLLVSNAGILTPGPLELLDVNAIRNEFDVNVFGVLTVVQAFLPALRASQGRIVQISTVSVDLPLPFNGPSSASKAAAETLLRSYRAELAASGVDVIIAVPGSMRTGGPAKTAAALDALAESMSTEQRRLYGDAFTNFSQRLNAGQSAGMSSSEAASEIIDLAVDPKAPPRLPIGDEARGLIASIESLTPNELDEKLAAFAAPAPQ
ncbi:MAG: SDR family NAD(P)-dependent oxidoreductase [Microthrixaceae bacterium]|nr:SDR family NAD(P)-dependent oxidoreductase [Microthrixaceae bacterium]